MKFPMIGSLVLTGIGGLIVTTGCQMTAPIPTNGTVAQLPVAPQNVRTAKATRKPVPAGVLTGQAALQGDWTTDAPGVRRLITVDDLPKPFATPSVDRGAHMVPQPEGAWPRAPKGFTVERFAEHLANPRIIRTAPNGDLFVAESGPGRIRILRQDSNGKLAESKIFAEGLKQPFGIAFYPVGPNPRYVYVANTDSVVRFPYKNGDLAATSAEELIVSNVPGGGHLRGGGHWTRDIVFSPDSTKLYLSIGSRTNVNQEQDPIEEHRARIIEYVMDGNGKQSGDGRVYASGIRNPVGIAVQPGSGTLWTSVNERDALGDNLVPDYITHVQDGGFYGWPWYYMGSNQDPRQAGQHPELRGKVTVPDVLLQSHYASLGLVFYTGNTFPRDYKGDIFASEHGSWNRLRRNGYKVVRVPLQKGRSNGVFEDFLTGFVTPEGDVWGRPVGVAVAKDGALMVTDDGTNSVWRVAYTGNSNRQTAKR